MENPQGEGVWQSLRNGLHAKYMVKYGVKCFFGALPRMIPFEKRQVNLSASKKVKKSSIKSINVQFNVQRNPAAYRTNRCIMFDVTVSKGFSCILVSGCKFMKKVVRRKQCCLKQVTSSSGRVNNICQRFQEPTSNTALQEDVYLVT